MRTRHSSPILALAAGLALASVAPAQDPVVRFEVSGAEADHAGFFARSVTITDHIFVYGAPYDDATGVV